MFRVLVDINGGGHPDGQTVLIRTVSRLGEETDIIDLVGMVLQNGCDNRRVSIG